MIIKHSDHLLSIFDFYFFKDYHKKAVIHNSLKQNKKLIKYYYRKNSLINNPYYSSTSIRIEYY